MTDDDNTAIEQAAGGTECVLLHDSLPPEQGSDPAHMRGSVVFTDPRWIITCHCGPDIGAAFAAIDRALDQGFYVAGGFTYELGYHLEERLRPLAPSVREPLFQVGVFGSMMRLEPGAVDSCINSRTDGPPAQAGKNLIYGMDAGSYSDRINRLYDYILSGDIYQANFTFPVSFSWSGDVWQLYRFVAPYQKVAFGAVLDLPTFKVASLSPELFFRMSGGVIESRPMKGTMRRGGTIDEDDALRWKLQTDHKNRAENLMIVDLIRNDLGRMARTGCVSVENLFQVETYGTLHQMVSTVRAEVEGTPRAGQIFRHLFPCGSVTGAPKIRAMEIIAELEDGPRGIYTGAIGYLTPDRDMTMSVPIRTMTMPGNGTVQMGIGSGIVADSGARDEYEECLLKARFLLDALQRTKQRTKQRIKRPVGLIETMRCENGVIPLIECHKSRLTDSAAHFGIHTDFTVLWHDVEAKAAATNGPQRVRLELGPDSTWSITSTPLDCVGTHGNPRVLVSDVRLRSDDSLLVHKTTRRERYDEARHALQGVENGFDVLLFNERGELCEGGITNVFLEMDGVLYTPPLTAGLLPGIMRAKIITERDVRERTLYETDVRDATRIFLSNAVCGMVEVTLAN